MYDGMVYLKKKKEAVLELHYILQCMTVWSIFLKKQEAVLERHYNL